MPLAVVLSVAGHAAIVVWLSTATFASHRSDELATTPIEIIAIERPPAVEPPPLDVALIPEPPMPPADLRTAVPAALPRTPALPPAAPAPPPAAAAAIVVPGSSGTTAETPSTTPPRSPLLAMRRPGELSRPLLPAGRWDDLDHVPAGTSPEKSAATGILHESGGGTHSSDQRVFTAKVNRDGSVDLKDARNLQVKLALPMPKDILRGIAAWYESDKGASGKEGDTSLADKIQVSASPKTESSDPSNRLTKDRAVTAIIPILRGGFDLTDWLTRRNGDDPYASKKLAFLDATRDERVQIASRHRAAQLTRTPQLIQRTLDALAASALDASARKQALFELWDDCVETGDPAVVEAGRAARRMVIGFIRARFPADSADAYTPDELAGLAQRKQSTAAFRPYDEP